MKATQADLFKRYDAYAQKLKQKIKAEFAALQLAGFDELTVIRTKQKVHGIFDRIDRYNREQYAGLCEWTYEWVYVQYGKDPPDRDWTKVVDDWLKGLDPVTMYRYDTELERKELRLLEGVLTARELSDRNALIDVVHRSADLLLTQSLQCGLDLIGEEELAAYGELGTELLLYHACNDSRTCSECREDEGKIFIREDAPRIPRHYRCRCWYTAVMPA